MATWKKVIVSGSAAELAHVTASTGMSAVSGSFGDVSASGTILAAKLDAAAVSDTLAAAIVAEIDNDEIPIAKLAQDAVTITAGDGLKNGGAVTLGSSVTLNIDVSDFAGTGLSGDGSENLNIDAAQTGINSILATDLVLGEDAQTKIDFETADEIHLDADNAQVVNVRAGGIEVTGDVTASAGISASGFTTPLGTVSGLSGSFGDVSASGTILAAKLDAASVSDTLAAAIVAEIDNDEIPIAKLAQDAVTVTAGDGLKGGGSVTLGSSVTLNVDVDVMAGVGLTADNSNEELDVSAAQTGITSIKNTSLEVGRDNDNSIKFAEDNQIQFRIAATDSVHVFNAKGIATGDVSASGTISASGGITSSNVTGSFFGDGSGLTGVSATTFDIDGLSTGTDLHQTQDHFVYSDNGTEKKITFSNVEDAIFGNVSGDATIAAGGAVTIGTIGANHIDEISNLTSGEGAQLENINSVTISNTQWGYLGALNQSVTTTSNVQFNNVNVDGNLVVAGTASFEETANLNVKDRFISLASGSAAGGDGGIVVNQALGNVPSGSAFGYEAGTADRWAVQANFVPTGSAMVPDAYMGIVTFSTSAPTGNPQYGGANYGYGNIHVDTDDGDIYIYA